MSFVLKSGSSSSAEQSSFAFLALILALKDVPFRNRLCNSPSSPGGGGNAQRRLFPPVSVRKKKQQERLSWAALFGFQPRWVQKSLFVLISLPCSCVTVVILVFGEYGFMRVGFKVVGSRKLSWRSEEETGNRLCWCWLICMFVSPGVCSHHSFDVYIYIWELNLF